MHMSILGFWLKGLTGFHVALKVRFHISCINLIFHLLEFIYFINGLDLKAHCVTVCGDSVAMK